MDKDTKKFIIITSVSEPTIGLNEFSEKKGWNIIVVGDKKTPNDWSMEGVDYLSVKDQKELNYSIVSLLPYNHYCRKMIGYLYAMEKGADVIYDTDDDNIPYPEWKQPEFKANKLIDAEGEFLNIYKYFTNEHVWPRGLPLNQISNKEALYVTNEVESVGVWQGLADKDPDVDAIFRLIFDREINFENQENVAVKRGSFCPFNSQNTFWRKDFFPLMYLPSTVTFRFTDILRGYIAQKIIWNNDAVIGFTGPSVYQERNEHDLMSDFKDEVSMYTGVEKVVDLLNRFDTKDVSNALLEIYEAMVNISEVKPNEMEVLSAWLSDVKKYHD